MFAIKIRLESAKNAALFVASCQDYECDIDLSFGRYTIDAKSILGVMSISSDNVCTVTIHSDDYKIINQFIDDMKLWTTKIIGNDRSSV